MEMTAQSLAELLGGEVVGDPSAPVSRPARIEHARKGDVCFYANPRYERYVYGTKASVLLVGRDFEPARPVSATLIRVDDPYAAIAAVLGHFASSGKRGNRFWSRLSLRRSVALSARIGKGTYIYPQVYVGPRVKIGRDCILYPGVRIYHDCEIGDRCILHAGAVIGADGFGFAPQSDGTWKKIPQLGNVVVEDDVEVGANSTIDRATMGSTRIGRGVKIDNLCQVAHNVEVGDGTVMAAMTGLAGSAHIGKRCMFGGQSGVNGHVTVADGTVLAGHSGIIGDIRKPDTKLMGYPALDYGNFMRSYAIFRRQGTTSDKK